MRVTVTRNYGVTANEKAQTLIKKLIFATTLVVVLVLFALRLARGFHRRFGGHRDAGHDAARFLGLGFHAEPGVAVRADFFDRHPGRRRHRRGGKHPSPSCNWAPKSMREAIPAAVDEVGGPTILATFTVIAALLPMAFVTGLMGPYMSPIPINASIGMLISLAVAFIVTPWLCLTFLQFEAHTQHAHEGDRIGPGSSTACCRPSCDAAKASRNRALLAVGVLVLIPASISLVGFKLVVLKMLPFDNKSEFQVVRGHAGSQHGRADRARTGRTGTLSRRRPGGHRLSRRYAGTAAPINFNGWFASITCAATPTRATFR